MSTRIPRRYDGAAAISVGLILIAAVVVRVVLATRGGAGYSSDEVVHFGPARQAAVAVAAGHWEEALSALVAQQHHMGFRVPSAIVAITAHAIAPGDAHYAALVLSLSSVAVILLVYAIARRAGAPGEEATIAMLFAATATSLTYFARHLMPYDTGLAFDLFALWLALRAGGLGRAIAVGAVACFGFLTYYAYLAIAALAAVVHVLRTREGRVRRLLGVVIGAAAVFACFEIVTVTWSATLPWAAPFHIMLWRFLHGAPESWGSSYAEGWWVPWAYLWHVEHAVFALWVLLAVAGWRAGAPRARWWGRIVLALYAWLVLHSTVLGESVVLGRFVRQIVPFLALAAAAGLAAILDRLRRDRRGAVDWRLGIVAAAAYAVLVGFNLSPVLAQRFPTETGKLWNARYGTLSYDQTLLGPNGTAGSGRYVAVNLLSAGPPWPVVGVREEALPGCVLDAYPHPLAWSGYQYEGYTEAARAAIRARPYLMALIDRAADEPCTHYPPPAGDFH